MYEDQGRRHVFTIGGARYIRHWRRQCIEARSIVVISPRKARKIFFAFIFQLSGWALVAPSCFCTASSRCTRIAGPGAGPPCFFLAQISLTNVIRTYTSILDCGRSAISDDGARLDVAMYGFWGGRFGKAFLDVRVFNPSAKSNQTASITPIYRRHENEKKREYEQRIREVEHATFTCTPLVMSTT